MLRIIQRFRQILQFTCSLFALDLEIAVFAETYEDSQHRKAKLRIRLQPQKPKDKNLKSPSRAEKFCDELIQIGLRQMFCMIKNNKMGMICEQMKYIWSDVERQILLENIKKRSFIFYCGVKFGRSREG